jgi:myo-inositol-hexaphosphate 3-phosphohydrolase
MNLAMEINAGGNITAQGVRDFETISNTKGFVVLDRTDGNRYRIYTDGGVLNTELA